MPLEIGSLVEGKITGISDFGAFISLPEGLEGMVHISEVDDAYVVNIREHLKVGDAVRVKILKINAHGKYDLSIRQAKGHRAPCFDDLMERFLKDSKERQADLKKNTESKQGKSRGRF